MSLELAWKNEDLELPPGLSKLWSVGYGGCYAVRESGLGYESTVHCFAIGSGSGTSIPGVKWKMKGSTGELIEGPVVVGWWNAGFVRYAYDPSDGGILYGTDPYNNTYAVDPDTMVASSTGFRYDGYPNPGMFSNDGSTEFWIVSFYGRIADREILIGHDNADYQDEMSIYNHLTNRESGRVIVPMSYNSYRTFVGVTKDFGYLVGYNGVISPVQLMEGYDQSQMKNHAGRSLRADPRLFTNWKRLVNNFVDPITKNVLRFDISSDQSKVTMWCFKQNPSPSVISSPVPTAIPREGRRVELVSQVYSSTGRPCSNWDFDISQSGNATITPVTPAAVTDHHGNVRLSMDCGDDGDYSQTVGLNITVDD